MIKLKEKFLQFLLFIAWAYEIPEFEIAILDKVMAFIGAVALSNVILLSYKLIEHKDLPSNWQTGIAMIAAIMLVAGLMEVGSSEEDPGLRVFSFLFNYSDNVYSNCRWCNTKCLEIRYCNWRSSTNDCSCRRYFVGTDNLSILWIGYLILTVAFPAGNYVAWDKYEAK